METTCIRCHQAVPAGASFCANCGLPQLVFGGETASDSSQAVRWQNAVRDAGSVSWQGALRPALSLGIPAGVMCSFLSPVGILGFVLMGLAGAWAVSLYMRHQQPAWITLGAGARIGFVTGIIGSWTAAASTGITLFALRFWAHQGRIFDNFWSGFVDRQLIQEWNSMGVDAQTIATFKGLLLSPEGRAGWVLSALCFLTVGLLIFAVAGGALSARIQIRRRRPRA